ncbi:hypothetical protein NL676_003656 [Syzygium grande]|nr:hypothetical protein NL676_003656 [Syzygium grande]
MYDQQGSSVDLELYIGNACLLLTNLHLFCSFPFGDENFSSNMSSPNPTDGSRLPLATVVVPPPLAYAPKPIAQLLSVSQPGPQPYVGVPAYNVPSNEGVWTTSLCDCFDDTTNCTGPSFADSTRSPATSAEIVACTIIAGHVLFVKSIGSSRTAGWVANQERRTRQVGIIVPPSVPGSMIH